MTWPVGHRELLVKPESASFALNYGHLVLNSLQNAGSFVVVLIDGDGAKFRDEFLRDHEHGAAKAAWKLKEAVKHAGFGHDVPIIVRAYANVNDLAKSLRLSGVIDHDDILRIFVQNFTNTTADFDFINVGKGKENTDSKIRSEFSPFVPQICLSGVLTFSPIQDYWTIITKTSIARRSLLLAAMTMAIFMISVSTRVEWTRK